MLDAAETCLGFSMDDFTLTPMNGISKFTKIFSNLLMSDSPQETYNFGKSLGEKLQPRDLVALCGDLGAGKTCLTQGIAKGLGVPEEYRVTSPTFTIINEYPGRLTLYHLDMYRLSGVRDLDEIGYDDCFNDRGVVVMEWAEKIKEVLPENAIYIFLTYIDANKRKIIVSHNRKEIDRLFYREELSVVENAKKTNDWGGW